MSEIPGQVTAEPGPTTIRLPPELGSVSQARAKLAEVARTWGCSEQVVEDAQAVLSELMSNGVLHARTELQVVISLTGQGGLRVEVHDASPIPLLPKMASLTASDRVLGEAAPGRAHPRPKPTAPPAATGRGLSMVAALASDWGWSPNAGGGKVVWAELGTLGSGEKGAQAAVSGRPEPYPVRPVRLVAVPLWLVKGSEDNLDELFRELQMATLALVPTGSARRPGLVRGKLAPLAEGVKSRLGPLREPLRRAIWDAGREGARLMDVNLLVDVDMPGVLDVSESLLAQSAKAARLGLLLTEPVSKEIADWRRWLRGEMSAQIAGRPPRACPFPVVTAPRGDPAPAGERLGASRRAVLSELDALLASGSSPAPGSPSPPARGAEASAGVAAVVSQADVMTAALLKAARCVGAKRAVLCTLTEDNETVKHAASVGFSPAERQFWQTLALSADLPALEALRTGRMLVFRNIAEFRRRYPVFVPAAADPAQVCAPLVAGTDEPALGCLVVGFAQARDFRTRDVQFLSQVAYGLASFTAAQRRLQDSALAARRDVALGEACAAIAAATSEADVTRELLDAIVALVADGAALHLAEFGEENPAARFVATRHRRPEREAVAAELLQVPPADYRSGLIADCLRTGRAAVVQYLPDEAMVARARDISDLALLRQLAIGSVGVAPVRAEGRILGVASFAKDVGRFVTDDDLGAVQRLADQAGGTLARLGRGTSRQEQP